MREVGRFVGCGGLAKSLAPGRGTYGLVRSAAFQGCKDRRKILKWRHMRAFSGSVSEWCGRADAARLLPQQPPSGRAAAARTQAAAAPAAAWRLGSIRLAAGQHPPRPNGCWPVPERMLRPGSHCLFVFHLLQTSRRTLQHRCGRGQASYTTLGSRPAPGTPSAKRSVGTRRAASMWDTLSEGTARAAQLAPSAVTASAVGGSATRSVVDRVSPTTSGSSTPHDRACSSTCPG